MFDLKEILRRIKATVDNIIPNAQVILYGSYARAESNPESDLDLLILVDGGKISRELERKIKYPLYDIEFEIGKIISPLVLSKLEWETRHRITPFYENVGREGVVL